MSPNKVVLVTGAGGFIGRWSVPALIARGYEVHAVAAPASRRELPPQLRDAHPHWVDLLAPEGVGALLAAVRPSHLLHFAWIAVPGVYWTSVENARWLAASRQLLTGFEQHGGIRAVMAGSCAEYDWSCAGVCHEFETPLADTSGAPITPYAECKIALQHSLSERGRSDALSTAWGRIFFQFGPDEHPRRLVASVICSLLAGREALCSHGRQIRSFLHVADVGAAFAALLDGGIEGPVNVGSGAGLSIATLLNLIAAQLGRSDLLRLGARQAPAGEPMVLLPDVRRLTTEVGWRPQWTVGDAVTDTIAWWRSRVAAG